MTDEGVRVRRGLVIPEAELRWRFDAAGGPGGQHANTANTRAELRFDIAGSPTLGPRQRARLLAKARARGPGRRRRPALAVPQPGRGQGPARGPAGRRAGGRAHPGADPLHQGGQGAPPRGQAPPVPAARPPAAASPRTTDPDVRFCVKAVVPAARTYAETRVFSRGRCRPGRRGRRGGRGGRRGPGRCWRRRCRGRGPRGRRGR